MKKIILTTAKLKIKNTMEIYFRKFFLAMQGVAKRSTVGILCMVVAGLTTMSCKEDYDAKTYYKVAGTGYVFMYDAVGNIMYPVQGAEIIVTACLEGTPGLFGTASSVKETYSTDASGKYQVRFIKRTERADTWQYLINYTYLENGSDIGWASFENILTIDEVKNTKNTIVFDTIKFYKK